MYTSVFSVLTALTLCQPTIGIVDLARKQMTKWTAEAEKRLHNLERKLSSNAEMRQSYEEFMQEYMDLGRMTQCEAPSPNQIYYYLPHHAVIKESSTTTEDGKNDQRTTDDAFNQYHMT